MCCERVVRQVSSSSSPRVFVVHANRSVFIGYYGNWTVTPNGAHQTRVFAIKELTQRRLFGNDALASGGSCFISSTIVSPSVLVMDKLRGVVSVNSAWCTDRFCASSPLCCSRAGFLTSSAA